MVTPHFITPPCLQDDVRSMMLDNGINFVLYDCPIIYI